MPKNKFLLHLKILNFELVFVEVQFEDTFERGFGEFHD